MKHIDFINTLFSVLASLGAPKTGDTTNIILWILLMVASCVGIGALIFLAKKKKQDEEQ